MKYEDLIKNKKLTSFKETKELVLYYSFPRFSVSELKKTKDRQYILPYFDGGKKWN